MLDLVVLSLLIVSCFHLAFCEIPDQDLSQVITSYERVTSDLTGFDHKYFGLIRQGKERTVVITTLSPNDTIALHVSREYQNFPDRNFTFDFVTNIGWNEDEGIEHPHGDGIYSFKIPSFPSRDYLDATHNMTMEIKIEAVWCSEFRNSTCPFMIDVTSKEFPVLYMMLGILSGVGCVALTIVACCAALFFIRDRIVKKNIKQEEDRMMKKKLEIDQEGFNDSEFQDYP